MIQTYIEYCIDKPLCTSERVQEKIKKRATPNHFPDGCYAFRFFDSDEIEMTNGEILRLSEEAQNYSGWFYLNGDECNIEEAKEKYGHHNELIKNMKDYNVERIVVINGKAIYLEKEDTVIKI